MNTPRLRRGGGIASFSSLFFNCNGSELGRNPVSKSMEMSRLTRDGTAEPVSRDQILRHKRGQENIHFSCSADHVQDW